MSTERLESPGSIPSLFESSAPPPSDVQNQTPDVPRVAEYPFDDQYADVILRTSDNVLFHIHKFALIYASGFFRDLFTIPDQNSNEDGGIQSFSKSSSPITLDVPEDSITMKSVLHWCYPVPHSDPTNIASIERVLAVAAKYDMAGVTSYMRRPLRDLHQDSPIQVYALSCKFGYSDLATDAAEVLLRERRSKQARTWQARTSSQDIEWSSTVSHSIYAPELAPVSAASFLRLLHFVRDGTRPANFCQRSDLETVRVPEVYPSVDLNYPNGDLIIRSELGDSVNFKVHRQIISFGSPLLEEKIQSITESSVDSNGLSVLELPEGSRILGLLLKSCYPSGDLDPATFDPSDIPLLAAAAVKYGVGPAIAACKKRLAELTLTDPFRAYSLSIRCDWKEDARNAAIRLARLAIEEEYHQSMENMDSLYYYTLLEFCHRYRKTLFTLQSEFLGRTLEFGSDTVTFSHIFTQCNDLWGNQPVYLQDIVCLLPSLIPIHNSNYDSLRTVNPATHLQEIYKKLTEQLDKLQLDWDEVRRRSYGWGPARGGRRGRGRR